MPCDVCWLLELREDVLREDLSELDTHLVCTAARRVGRTHVIVSIQQTNVWHSERTERVDTPNNTLRENLMFVECDECTERRRCNLGDQDAVAWAVAFEDFGFDECFGSVWAHFLQVHTQLTISRVLAMRMRMRNVPCELVPRSYRKRGLQAGRRSWRGGYGGAESV